MGTKDDLVAVRELLSEPSRWTKHFLAADSNGQRVNVLSQDATCWCVSGAARKVLAGDPSDDAFDQFARALGFDPYGDNEGCTETIPEWNDAPERTHADVLDRLNRAIARQP